MTSPPELPLFDRGLSWLCWAYNEEQLIGDYLRRVEDLLSRTVRDYEIVVVDDGSTDRTPEIIQGLRREIPALRCFRNERNLNVGYSFRRAILRATKEFLMWQTIDWSYDLSRLREYLELLKSYDVVAGVRWELPVGRQRPPTFFDLVRPSYLRHRSDTVRKALVSVVNYLLIRVLFRIPLADFQNVVFYPTRLIQSLEFEATSSFANPEGLIKAFYRGSRIVQVPIPFIPRPQGVAKGTRPRAIANSVKDIVRLWFAWIVLGRLPRRRPGSIVWHLSLPGQGVQEKRELPTGAGDVFNTAIGILFVIWSASVTLNYVLLGLAETRIWQRIMERLFP